MKHEKGGKIITKFAVTIPKSDSYCLQKETHEIEDSVNRQLRFSDYETLVHDTINAPIKKYEKREKDKRSRVKSDKPAFNDQTWLDKSEILLYVFKYEYMILR